MTDDVSLLVQDLGAPALGSSARVIAWRWLLTRRWDAAVALVALVAGAVALWSTLNAGFLAHPGWLAAQKVDFIVGPIGVGFYWRHRRPENRFGLLLIALGLAGVLYIPQASATPALFGVGVLAETPIYVLTSLVILTFPTGRLDGAAARLIFGVVLVFAVVTTPAFILASPQASPAFSISGCLAACPANGLSIWPAPSWLTQLSDVQGVLLVAVPIATLLLLGWRFVTGTPPRRRAMAVGGPIALVFLIMQASYRTLFFFAPNGLAPSARPVQNAMQWTFAAARSFLWYGFLLALIAAELFAGRALRELVGSSLGRPSFGKLEEMVRRPLGDPGLRLGFWRQRTHEWIDRDGGVLVGPGQDQTLTEVDRDGRPAVVILHDRQLADDPELLQAAGTVALLALENATLEAGWAASLRDLADSRARLTKASDRERRKLERDLHDGAQQRLLAALIRLSSADEAASEDPELQRQLTATRRELEAAIEELRDLARGIFPSVLSQVGLAGALRAVVLRARDHITVTATDKRFPPETEAAFYFCCLEAVQNAFKHAGPGAQISIHLFMRGEELHLEVRDTGSGFDAAAAKRGFGLQSMQDRLGAVEGRIEIESHPGAGTLVSAIAPAHPIRVMN